MMLHRYKTLLILGFLLFSASVSGQTVVQSIITADQNWKATASPFIVDGNVLIDSGVSVTVEPGVVIRGTGKYRIIVKGEFVAEGTASSVIEIDSVNFEFEKEAVPYNFGTGTGSRFEYVVFNSWDQGGMKQIETNDQSLLISNCEFNNCYYCIWGYGYYQSGADSLKIKVESSTFHGNYQGYVTYMSGLNTILELDDVYAERMGGIYLAQKTTITNSEFYDFKYFSGLRMNNCNYVKLSCNRFAKFRTNILDMSYVKSGAHLEFTYNTLDSADYLVNYYVSSSNPTDFTFEYNNLLHAGVQAVKCQYGIDPGQYINLDMQNNYWGTTDTNEIKDAILDFNDDITAGVKVNWSNYLSSEVTSCTNGGGNINAIQSVDAIQAVIYPNPANEVVQIDHLAPGQYEVQLMDNTGRVVYEGAYSGKSHLINTASFMNGLYILEVIDESGARTTHKMMIRH